MDFSKIKELKPYDLNCNIFDVYSYDGLSMQELLCQFFTKINECIKTSNETIDLAEWLVNEGLKQEVAIKLTNWLNDGTFENLINVTLFENLNNKIDNVSSQLEHVAIYTKEQNTDDETHYLNSLINECIDKNIKLVIKNEVKINSFLEIPGNLNIEFENGYFNVGEFDVITQKGGWVYFNNPQYPIKPEWFGAKGNGVSDDTKALQNCIDSGLNPNVFPIGKTQNEAGKGHTSYNKICIDLNNSYKISSPIVLRAEYHFNSCLITSTNKTGVINGSTTDNGFVDKCFVIKKPDNYPSSDIDYQTQKTIENLRMINFNYGIYFEGADLECRVLNNNFQGIKTSAIYLKQCDGVLVQGNYGSWVYGYLVELYYSNACRIINNHSGETSTTGAKGIKVEGGSGVGNLIEGNYLRQCSVTINNRIDKMDRIVNNTFYNSEQGVIINDSCRSVVIENNNFISCVLGMNLYKHHIARNNNFEGCECAIRTGVTGENNQIISNRFKNCTVNIKHNTSKRDQIISNMFIGGIGIDSNNFGYDMFISNNTFIDCDSVHNFTSTTSNQYAKFGYNYSTQKGFVLGNELN